MTKRFYIPLFFSIAISLEKWRCNAPAEQNGARRSNIFREVVYVCVSRQNVIPMAINAYLVGINEHFRKFDSNARLNLFAIIESTACVLSKCSRNRCILHLLRRHKMLC